MRVQLQDPTSAKAAAAAINSAQPGQYGRLVSVDGVTLPSPFPQGDPELGIDKGLLIEAVDVKRVFDDEPNMEMVEFTVWGEKVMFSIGVSADTEVVVGHVQY